MGRGVWRGMPSNVVKILRVVPPVSLPGLRRDYECFFQAYCFFEQN